MIIPVILSGGVGSRLWPLSRAECPKQFAIALGERTLFQETVLRNQFCQMAPLCVSNESHRFLLLAQLEEIQVRPSAIILEPQGRNTAPAIALAAWQALQYTKDPLLLISPSDHVITDVVAFENAVLCASSYAREGYLVTFGCEPTVPATGYGYIQRGCKGDDHHAFMVRQFVEKPDANHAKRYVDSGEYYWNSGIFLFSAKTYLSALEKYAPDIFSASRCAAVFSKDHYFLRPDRAAFLACPSDSIDYAVMQKAERVAVVPLNAGWSDMGSWDALYVQQSEEHSNVIKGDVICEDTEKCYIQASHRLVATIGLKDLVVIETRDAVLVADKKQSQSVKKIVQQLETLQRPETIKPTRLYRPWGLIEILEKSSALIIRRLTLKPAAHVAMQVHHHRSEHWVVVSGLAHVICNEQERLLQSRESFYIPAGAKHYLENRGETPLIIIEVQLGDFVDEQDVERFEEMALTL